MDDAARKRLIAQRSPLQAQVDPRPRCQECGGVLTRRDFLSYWDGQDPHEHPDLWYEPNMTADERQAATTPRCCEGCAEEMECRSV